MVSDNYLQKGRAVKKSLVTKVVLLFLSFLVFSAPLQAADLTPSNTQVYFSPNGGCTEAITKEIDRAKTDIFVQAYSFTSAPIAKALLNAHKRGVKVQAILDKSQKTAKYSSATFLYNAGVPTFIDAKHAIAHNKIMIIDRETVITGSFNFTKAAENSNAENLLVIKNKEIAKAYLDNWSRHKEHADKYERP
jgi:phosphatidylserine/phosphatidylglycerophosphate/cardiolipin synthase-like enzyme